MIVQIIPKHPDYTINQTGNVWSKRRKRFLKSWLRSGYPTVALTDNGKSCSFYIHRLLLETFVGPCPDGMECRHLDGNPMNYQLNNLCWGTYAKNAQDSVKHGTCSGLLAGENNSQAKLKNLDARIIVYMWRTELFNQQEIASVYPINCSGINLIVNKRTWKHIWRKQK